MILSTTANVTLGEKTQERKKQNKNNKTTEQPISCKQLT